MLAGERAVKSVDTGSGSQGMQGVTSWQETNGARLSENCCSLEKEERNDLGVKFRE